MKKIQQAEKNMKNYFSEGLIIKHNSFKKIIYQTYVTNYLDSLELAQEIYDKNKSSLWVIVISYYSMFYCANAVLYKLGYKIGHKIAHKITLDALIVFVRHKLKKSLLEIYDSERVDALTLSDNLIENFSFEREKRSKFQYETTDEIKKSKALTSLTRAKQFNYELMNVIQK